VSFGVDAAEREVSTRSDSVSDLDEHATHASSTKRTAALEARPAQERSRFVDIRP
jgi:hypothetical protein